VRKFWLGAASVLCAGNLFGQITVLEPIPQTATIDVNAAAVGGEAIPRTIFGSFLEPIGNSTYNGLWAEILRERPELVRASSEGLPLPWEPEDARQGNRYEVHRGDAANSWQSLEVMGVPGEATGIKQRVYLPVHRTLSSNGSFYAKHLSGKTGIQVTLRARDTGVVLAAASIDAKDTEWKKYTFALQVPEGALHRLDPADFVVEVAGDERVALDEFSLMPADAIDGMDPDEIAMARAMKTAVVRFGGNFTSGYHWRDGIGPRDQRTSMMNLAWGIPEYNTFGTDEFLEFCKQIGAEPQVALNLGTGTAEEAAGWVRYIDQHWTTHSGLLWELGNELWGNWNTGYPTRAEIGPRTAEYSGAIRAVDPTARLIATGADPDSFKAWDAEQLKSPVGTFDYLSTHFVVGTGTAELRDASPAFIAAAGLALPVELEQRVRQEQALIDSTPGYQGKVHVAFTEWLFNGTPFQTPSFANMDGALMAGGFLNMVMRNAEIVPISDMTGIQEFAGIWKKRSQVYATPAYYVFKLYAGADMARAVEATSRAGSYAVAHGVARLPEIDKVPYFNVFAAVNADRTVLTLFCVNRSLDTDIPAAIRLSGFAAGKTVEVHTVSGKSLSDGNDEMVPNRVVPMDSVETAKKDGWTHVFPHESVTVLSVRAAQ
jgi:alpha-N-arabinofuranosidase